MGTRRRASELLGVDDALSDALLQVGLDGGEHAGAGCGRAALADERPGDDGTNRLAVMAGEAGDVTAVVMAGLATADVPGDAGSCRTTLGITTISTSLASIYCLPFGASAEPGPRRITESNGVPRSRTCLSNPCNAA